METSGFIPDAAKNGTFRDTTPRDQKRLIRGGGKNKAIELEQFLKKNFSVQSGGHAKTVIQAGEVSVNGQVETRRGRKLKPGDFVQFEGENFTVPGP